MIYFKPASDIITLASLFTSWEECKNPTSIFSSLFNFSRSLGTLHKTVSECEYIFSQLLFPTFNTSPLIASGSMSFPWKKKKRLLTLHSFAGILAIVKEYKYTANTGPVVCQGTWYSVYDIHFHGNLDGWKKAWPFQELISLESQHIAFCQIGF